MYQCGQFLENVLGECEIFISGCKSMINYQTFWPAMR